MVLCVICFEGFLQDYEGLGEVIFIQDIGHTDFVSACSGGGVEAGAGGHHNGLAFVGEIGEAPDAEFLGVVHREADHGVEGTHGGRGIDSGDLVESVDEEVAPLEILFIDFVHVLLGGADGGLGYDLAHKGRREPGLAEFHHGLADGFVPGDKAADADAALGVALGHGIDKDDIVVYVLQVEGGDIGLLGVDELAIDFVGEKIEIVFLDQVAYLQHFLAGVEVARGVVGVADEDGFGARGDLLLKFLYRREAEAVVDGGGHGLDDRAAADGEGHVVGVGGVGDYDFITGVEAGHVGEHHGFGASGGDDDIVRAEVDAVGGIVGDHLGPERQVALGGTVLEDVSVHVADRLDGALRGLDVGLADVQVIDVDAVSFGRFGVAGQLPYRGTGHIVSST